MPTIHCKLDYHRYSTSALETMSNQVANGIYSNTQVFATPIIQQAAFENVVQNFNTAAADYATYGPTKKTAFTNARKKLIDTLDLTADYVDGVALGDDSIIILSGYQPTSAVAQSNIPINKIESFTALRTQNSCEIAVEIPSITGHGGVHYFCICSEGAPIANTMIANGQLTANNTNTIRYDFTKSRKKVFNGLTAGTNYYFYVFASNTVSVSPLSDPKTVMAAS